LAAWLYHSRLRPASAGLETWGQETWGQTGRSPVLKSKIDRTFSLA